MTHMTRYTDVLDDDDDDDDYYYYYYYYYYNKIQRYCIHQQKNRAAFRIIITKWAQQVPI